MFGHKRNDSGKRSDRLLVVVIITVLLIGVYSCTQQ
jgi:hypothetical protein